MNVFPVHFAIVYLSCSANCTSNIFGSKHGELRKRKTVRINFAGYKFDEHDRDSVNLRLQFARYPGARSGGGHRGKR